MKGSPVLLLVAMLAAAARPAAAHPAPFTYLDARLESGGIEVTLVAHVFDVAHDLQITPPEQLVEPVFLAPRSGAIVALLAPRLQVSADGIAFQAGAWSAAEPLPERQSIRLRVRYEMPVEPGVVSISTRMFPYDPVHQTFVNVYEREELTLQAILDQRKTRVEYFPGSRQGAIAVVKRFVPVGVRHILAAFDHLLFLLGLLLLGGSIRQLALIVTAFTLAHSITLTLTALHILQQPPARFVEPALALNMVYLGADNLMVRGGRDVRMWIALGFGFIHGFGFAHVLREMDLPRRALGWSLFSFNFGVELGQLLVVVAMGSAIVALRARNEAAGRRLAFAGSIVVILAGAFWFVQRVFFPGGAS